MTAQFAKLRKKMMPNTSPANASASSTGATAKHDDVLKQDDVLLNTLKTRFGHSRFRAGQREVCEAVIRGEDGLLVMPTGGGKSLCYQLPGLLREGPTLVISPLIALMDDQAGALTDLGIRAERIHSGLPRSHAREAARRYRDGELDFLFIAPERLRVPGFPEWLARYPPSLIAIDEAHCISMWGHDFRPEYRLLGERLPIIRNGARPVPILAMTATATVRVQRDMLRQLRIQGSNQFIRGFARDDMAIEVVDCAQADRPGILANVLSDDANRPALVYVLSRRLADELSSKLSDEHGLHASAYHAGMANDRRSRVQTQFLAGDLDVVVATVAFGMGIDKSDVRTVVHVGMPATIEGYYQEIGRAGRDRAGARVIALFNWGDRRTHEFLLDKSYPPLDALRALWLRIGPNGRAREELVTDKDIATALDKLVGHGVAEVDIDNIIRRRQGDSAWTEQYKQQRQWRTEQLDDAFSYVGQSGCRMAALVSYFGDSSGKNLRCGKCDHCAPQDCEVRTFVAPTEAEMTMMRKIVAALSARESDSTGRLFREHVGGGQPERKVFDRVLAGMERAGLLHGWMDTFEKEGKTISFRRVALERGDWSQDRAWPAQVELDVIRTKSAKKRKRSRSKVAVETVAADEEVVELLRTWRLGKARTRGVPPFVIFNDEVMRQIAAAMPTNTERLLAVKGMGAKRVADYGDEILVELQG